MAKTHSIIPPDAKWVPGKIKGGTKFLPLQDTKKAIRRKLKQSFGSQETRLQQRLKKINKALRAGKQACVQAPNLADPSPSPTPTVIPPNSQTVQWNVNLTERRGQNGQEFSY